MKLLSIVFISKTKETRGICMQPSKASLYNAYHKGPAAIHPLMSIETKDLVSA